MTKFKTGDIVVCVDDKSASYAIRKGSKYKVQSSRGELVTIAGDGGEGILADYNVEWFDYRFELDETTSGIMPFQGLETAYDNKPSPQNWTYKDMSEEFKYPQTLYKPQSVEQLQEAEAQRIASLGTPVLNAFKSLTGVSLTNAQYDILKGLEQLYKGAQ